VNQIRYYRFPNGITDEQISLLLTDIAIRDCMASKQEVNIIRIDTKDRFLVNRLRETNTSLLANSLYQT
jgi:hypothetical protein